MKIKLEELKKFKFKKGRALVLPHFEEEKIDLKKFQIEKNFEKILKNLKEGEMESILTLDEKRIIISNCGKKEKFNQRKFRIWIRKILSNLALKKLEKIEILLKNFPFEKSFLVKEAVCNLILADYKFSRFSQKKKEVKRINLLIENSKNFLNDLEEGKIIGEAVNFARDLSNSPAQDITPIKLAQIAKKEFKGSCFQVKILDKKEIDKLKLEGILAVSKGSIQEPRLIILKYFGTQKSKNFDLGFVGKGVTFDSGGLNIKPWEGMIDMYMDKSGASAIFGAIKAISKLKLPLNIVGIIPAVENMPSSSSYRPGDILKIYNGKTVEVINTDAEGRLILADALSYLEKNFKPKFILDVATLTGAAIVALGQRVIALFTNKEELEEKLRKIGEKSGDYVWLLPLWEEYQEEIRGDFADLRNVGKTKYGGAITGAIFLKNFIENTPWVHLDIAPTMTSIENQGLSKGATGAGTRYLIEFAKNFFNQTFTT